MLNKVDAFLNKITMYKVVLYYLFGLWILALLFSFFGWLPYTPLAMVLSLFIILAISFATNSIFAYVFKVPANVESIYITVFILALIITPAQLPAEYIFLGWVAILAMASKYIFAWKHKHIFNPAALAVAITAFTINGTASWWVGTLIMTPFVLAGGLLVVRKIVRKDLTLAFFGTALFTILFFSLSNGGNILTTLFQALFYSPLLFFTFIMITEPLTTPPSRWLRILYGMLVGFLFAPQVHFSSLYLTPELALLLGNVFSYLVSPKSRLTLKLKKVIKVSPDTAEFVFQPNTLLRFKPGQYLEWTLGHEKSDSRGNRRYFTISSSPTEKELRLGVKFYPEASSFKKALLKMKIGDTLIASQLAGDFVLPRNKNKKLVFLAGGIGVTPFLSMVKYLIDNKQKRDIAMVYSNKTAEDIAYKNFLDTASTTPLPLKMTYTLTDAKNLPTYWEGSSGHITERMIQSKIPDFKDRMFYVSGPHRMVSETEQVLKNLGVKNSQIKVDFFPGFA
jgi:ferredoxin-NADP reductase